MATGMLAISSSVQSGSIVLPEVAWETYCRLRDASGNDSIRMTYLDGSLTLMSPTLRHDQGSRLLFLVVAAVAEASRIEFEPTGTATLRIEGHEPRRGVGKEPDEGFYLGADAILVRNNEAIDLRVDPPPSLAIEVDHTGDSTAALASYARLGVPEVWLYQPTGPSLWFGRLVGEGYETTNRSVVLPSLTTDLVLEALATRIGGGMGTLAWTSWLRGWAAGLIEP